MTILLRYPEISPDCEHIYPDDWTFGGAKGGDPRADQRFLPTIYTFLDRMLSPIYIGSDCLCDHEAIHSKRLRVDNHHTSSKVFYIRAERPDGCTEMIYSDIEGALGGSAG